MLDGQLRVIYVSRAGLSFIFKEAKRSKETMDNKKCCCVIKMSFGLPCAFIIVMKIHHKKLIRLDEIKPPWKRLCMSGEE